MELASQGRKEVERTSLGVGTDRTTPTKTYIAAHLELLWEVMNKISTLVAAFALQLGVVQVQRECILEIDHRDISHMIPTLPQERNACYIRPHKQYKLFLIPSLTEILGPPRHYWGNRLKPQITLLL
jgi:hypothetical protein